MRRCVVPLALLALILAGCVTHEAPRCSGKLERINRPETALSPDAHGQ